MKLIPIKQYIDEDSFDMIYTVSDDNGTKFILDNDEGIFFGDKNILDTIQEEDLKVPNCKYSDVEIFKVDDILGVYDGNLNLLWELCNISDVEDLGYFTHNGKTYSRKDFSNFTFSTEE